MPISSRLHARGVPITLASDAHAPHEVAADFDSAVQLLREVGYTSFVTYAGRQRRDVSLPEVTAAG
jgi:histidinol-phosphatase (PHP family)